MKNKNIGVNKFDFRLQELFSNRNKQRIKAKYQERNFYDRTAKIGLWLLVLSFGCSVFSAYSEHFYLQNFISSSMQRQQLAMVLVVVLIVVIELIKRSVIPSLFQYYFQYGKVEKVSAVIVVVFCSISIFSSFEGAKLIPQQLSPAPLLYSLDSVKTIYDGQLATLDKSIKRQEKTTWKGRITAQANKNIAQLNRQKSKLQDQQAASMTKTTEENEGLLADYQLALAVAGNNIGYATLVCECLLLLIIGFLEYRDFTVFALANAAPTSPLSMVGIVPDAAAKTQTSTIATTKTGETGEKRAQIGFKSYGMENDDRSKTKEKIVEKVVIVQNGDRVRNCLHCGTSFQYKHWNKQYCGTKCRVKAWEERTGKKR